MSWIIEPIGTHHDRQSFECGKDGLNEYIRRWARDRDTAGIGKTYVAVAPGASRVLGYHTIAASNVSFKQIPKQLPKSFPKHPIPTVHIGRLAVETSCQGQGLGKNLIIHSLKLAASVSRQIGVYAVDVYADDEEVRRFYKKLDFVEMADTPDHLYMEIELVREIAKAAGLKEEPAN